MANENEPRALSAALASPAFHTRGGGGAMHAADRHVERWAPEAGASRQRPLRNLGFVDRLIAPWIETSQRSASLRLFSQYAREGVGERAPGAVSWVFPRPWYQDELDWMAAARQQAQVAHATSEQRATPSLFTTRGTYVPPQQTQTALPTALYEYVAPSLSVAQHAPATQIAGVGYGGDTARADAYSPIVPLAAVHAAEVMSRAIAPALAAGGATARMTPALRNVLSTMLERAITREQEPTRLSAQAPELVTPPHPSVASAAAASSSAVTASESAPAPRPGGTQAIELAQQYAEQRARIVEVQRVARQAAERELAARIEATRGAEADPRVAEARATEIRAAAQRAEAELRQRTAGATRDEQARRLDVERTVATERARAEERRIEERVAQRVTDRTRLHEQARAEAAAHARTAITPSATTEPTPVESERRAPAEIAAAIANLPPELATFIAAAGARSPERAMQSIGELGEALRTVELLARSAASGTPFESTRGPRLVMPAGLGGLVSAIDRAQMIGERPATLTGQRMLAPLTIGAIGAPAEMTMARAAAATRTGALPWLAASATTRPNTALDATAAATPAALSHVAWADRWLARFAGASQHSLNTLAASGASNATRMQMLAAAAPDSVFVAPFFFDDAGAGETTRSESNRTIMAMPAVALPPAAPSLTRIAPPPEAIRYDDNAETPDDVFAAISAAATHARVPAPATTAQAQAARAVERFTAADAVAHAAPSAPGAGFAAPLASSPFASALRHVLPLPAAPTFDVRALFGGGVSAAYLAGLLADGGHEIETGARTLPSWASWLAAGAGVAATERATPSWDPAYVAPDEIRTIRTMPRDADAASFDAGVAPLTTLRTALLSWDVARTPGDASTGEVTAATPASITTSTSSPITTATARAMIDAMSMPMLGDVETAFGPTTESAAAWTAPGMLATRAHAWSVAQERSSTDLALDFVTPELVLAARVYGLGPAEAAQAARLALAGPGHLSAMASTVDRTFVQALAIESDRRDRATREAITTAYPLPSGDVIAATGPTARAGVAAPPATTGAAFGVDRKSPRGAFLWPSATVAALGLNAAAFDGQQSMSVAALELLAAQAVAEIGTFAALGEVHVEGERAGTQSASPIGSAIAPSSAGTAAAVEPPETDVLGAATALVPAARRGRFDALYIALGQSPGGRGMSPAARAARALALAGRDPEGPVSARERAASAWDVLPVVYAEGGFHADDAGIEGPVTASRGIAMPQVTRAPSRPGEFVAADPWAVEMRPGLGGLSARAGEALGSYVAPVASLMPAGGSSSAAPTQQREVGAVLRAPTAAQELVRTGRPAGRHGGGEVEIPPWFEAAARKMLEDRSGASDGISLAELTLVSAAPSTHVAASTRTVPSAAPVSAGLQSQATNANTAQIDIEKLANEIYRHILVLMDVARARNGEPYL